MRDPMPKRALIQCDSAQMTALSARPFAARGRLKGSAMAGADSAAGSAPAPAVPK